MRKVFLLVVAGIATAMFAGSAMADTVTAPGGAIPAAGSGGGGSWTSAGGATALPTAPSNFNVFVPGGILGVNSITLTGMSHTWVGDLQMVLVDPTGVGHNIFVRPGLFFGGSTVGASSNFLGNYTFVASGAPNNLPTDTSQASTFNLPSGTYNQTFQGSAVAASMWSSGNFNIHNTPMGSITGAEGTWTLRFYDWAAGDVGALTSFTINYNPIPAPGALALLGIAGLAGVSRRRR